MAKILGIDPSSTKCGIALVENGDLLATWLWEKNEKKSGVWNLTDYFNWLTRLILTGDIKPTLKVGDPIAPIAAVEYLRVERGADVTRKISHFQAASALACKLQGLVVIECHVRTARKEALGAGNLSKDDSFAAVKKMYPDHTFRHKKKGGDDETDAVVLALAGPGIAEGA